MRTWRAGAALLGLAAAVLAACSELRPNLQEVYPTAMQRPRRPVIILPGAFGSRLKDERTGEVVWGRFTNLLSSRFKLILNPDRPSASDLLDLPIDAPVMTANRDHLIAYDMFDEVAGREFYRKIVRALTDVAGYKVGDIAHPQPGQTCFAFYYDWRRDVVENARLLSEAIDRVREAQPGGDAKVDLIAHSLGGIVARYYLKYGARDVLDDAEASPTYDGARHVETIVLIGVPNEGNLYSLESLNDGMRIVRRLPPEAIFTMPAAYQLLPTPNVSPFIDPSGRPLEIDLYRPEVWETYGWSAFAPSRLKRLSEEMQRVFGKRDGEARYAVRLQAMRSFLAAALDRARKLHRALDRPARVDEPVRHFAFGGDCTPTPARAMLLPRDDGTFRTITRLKDLPDRFVTPEIRRLMSEPGDGTVTRSSLLALHTGGVSAGSPGGLHLDYSLFLCDTHRNLTENITFQDNLLQFLLYDERESAPGGLGASPSIGLGRAVGLCGRRAFLKVNEEESDRGGR